MKTRLAKGKTKTAAKRKKIKEKIITSSGGAGAGSGTAGAGARAAKASTSGGTGRAMLENSFRDAGKTDKTLENFRKPFGRVDLRKESELSHAGDIKSPVRLSGGLYDQ